MYHVIFSLDIILGNTILFYGGFHIGLVSLFIVFLTMFLLTVDDINITHKDMDNILKGSPGNENEGKETDDISVKKIISIVIMNCIMILCHVHIIQLEVCDHN